MTNPLLYDMACTLTCPYCHAPPGKPCRSKGGRLMPLLHSARWKTARRLLRTQRP